MPVWWPHEADSLVTEEDLTEDERVVNFGWHLEVAYRMFAGPRPKPPTAKDQEATAGIKPQQAIQALLRLRGVVVRD